ncbi:MAG: hypothetical protein ACE5SW_03065 [Nitrososphaeraceae archaeon]
MSQLSDEKKIHVIVHGNRQIFEKVKNLLVEKKVKPENIGMASLDKAGELGEYVAMIWPPMNPKEIIVSEIAGTQAHGKGMGAWESIDQKELFRIPL